MRTGKHARKLLALLPGLASFPAVWAHCPLCTIGAAAVAGGALWMGVKASVVGVFMGAFAASTGWWAAGFLKRKWIPYQRAVIVLASFLLTIWPLAPLVEGVVPLYVSLWGGYGGWLNRTYVFDTFVLGSLLGLGIVSLTPWLSSRITSWRKGAHLPFQGVLLTLSLLIVAGGILQVL